MRVNQSPGNLSSEIVRAARKYDPGLPIGAVRTFEDVVRDSLRSQRFRANIISGFGLFALGLVVVGMYGSTAYSVLRRRRELAIRTALGARTETLIKVATRDAVVSIALGSLLGIAIGLGAARLVRTMLFGVGPLDPAVIAASVLVVAAAVMTASYLPARRAAAIDPAEVLRGD